MKELPVRKSIRLEGHDYSTAGAYFVTICVKDGHELLWDDVPVGAAFCRPRLSNAGKAIELEIQNLSRIYTRISITHYAIMPNHVHMIVVVDHDKRVDEESGRQNAAPTLSRIIGQWKRSISMKLGYSIWQKSFHDHIIRNETEYQKIWQYIENNPANRTEDCYHVK